MKRLVKIALPILCILLLLTACGGKGLHYENGYYTDSKSGISYEHAPAYYEAIDYLKDQKIGDLVKGGKVTAYTISGVDPTKMICTQYHEVLCAKGTKLPELHELQVTAALISKTMNLSAEYATITDANELKYLVDACSGEYFSGLEIDSTIRRDKYELKFEASNLTGVRYCLTYWRFDSDVLIYEDIDSPDHFTPTYSVDYTVHTYDNGAYYVAYNFGREILYNRATDKAYAINQTLAKYLTGNTLP